MSRPPKPLEITLHNRLIVLRAERDLSTTSEQPHGSPPTNSDAQQQLASTVSMADVAAPPTVATWSVAPL